MRIGGYEIGSPIRRFEEPKPPPLNPLMGGNRRKTTKERGGTGTATWGGNIDQEWNSSLTGNLWYTVADKMMLSDAMVQAVWFAITFLPRAATWDIKPASDDNVDQAIAKHIKDNLFGGMIHSFDDWLRQALLYLAYGSMGFEPIYELRDGYYVWRKFAVRKPHTFIKYNLDPETEELVSINQQVNKAGKWVDTTLPADNLMLLVHNMVGANYRGWGIFRAAWFPWNAKNEYCRMHGIAMDRWSVAIPKIKQTEGGAFDEDKAVDIAENFRAHEKAYLIEPFGYDTSLLTLENLIDPLPMITYYNHQITFSAFAQFMNVAQDKVGSYSALIGHKDVFLLFLQAGLKYVRGELDKEIATLVDYNWNVRGNYPTVITENLQAKDLIKLATGLSLLGKQGFITADPDLEEWIRKIGDLPELPKEQKVAAFDDSVPNVIKLQSTPEFKPWRELRPEEKFCDLEGIYAKLTGVENDFTKIAKELRREQIKIMLSQGLKALLKKNDLEFYNAADAIKVPHWNEMKKQLQDVLKDIYKYGKEQVRDEVGRQGTRKLQGEEFEPVEGDVASNRYLRKLSERSTEEINKGLLAGLSFGLYRLHSQGSTDLTALRGRLEALSDREITKAAGYSVSSAFNMGRRTGINDLIKTGVPVETAVYSAIMDAGTCSACAQVDGREVEVGSAEYEDIYPPLNGSQFQCAGGGRCRCVMIFIAAERAA